MMSVLSVGLLRARVRSAVSFEGDMEGALGLHFSEIKINAAGFEGILHGEFPEIEGFELHSDYSGTKLYCNTAGALLTVCPMTASSAPRQLSRVRYVNPAERLTDTELWLLARRLGRLWEDGIDTPGPNIEARSRRRFPKQKTHSASDAG